MWWQIEETLVHRISFLVQKQTWTKQETEVHIASQKQKRHLLLVEALIAEKADINLVQTTSRCSPLIMTSFRKWAHRK